MSDNFKGSIAQVNVQFPIETVVEPLAGENYSKVMIFVPVSKAAEYMPGISSVEAGTLTELKSSNYGDITGGLLKTWLIPFFKSAKAAKLGLAVYDDDTEATTNTMALVYEKYKMYAYFKLAIAANDAYNAAQVELSRVSLTDELYSAVWIGTSDANVLTSSSNLMQLLTAQNSNARVIYNPDATINPALAQLGASLSYINTTGTPVGNSIDMVSFGTISTSGSLDADGNRTNLLPTEKSALDAQKIGYQTYVGNGTGEVVTEGSLTLKGESVGANWTKHYIEYMCKVQTATMMTKMNKYRNNNTYQGIITILQSIVNDFVKLGRLANFAITAPIFSNLPKSGDTITVPDAWRADYVDNVREVTVYGTLYITQPTR